MRRRARRAWGPGAAVVILVIDNYDSFVQTLARYFRELGEETCVVRNDAIDGRGAAELTPRAIVFSPGPGRPSDAGASAEIIRQLSHSVPMLGVCLGHQCFVEAFGGEVRRARRPLHGEAGLIRHDGCAWFDGLANPFSMARYHSLIAEPAPGGPLVACAWSEEGEVMAVRHQSRPLLGVQFHPESVLSLDGSKLLQRFLAVADEGGRPACAFG